MDVLPVEPGTEAEWKYDAFSGAVAESFVWGRGTQDDKNQLIAIMEAVELLLKEEAKPQRHWKKSR